ncbi:hypothetical protein GEMRC1_007054 [Eukaryota sp. GEM-RC1]
MFKSRKRRLLDATQKAFFTPSQNHPSSTSSNLLSGGISKDLLSLSRTSLLHRNFRHNSSSLASSGQLSSRVKSPIHKLTRRPGSQEFLLEPDSAIKTESNVPSFSPLTPSPYQFENSTPKLNVIRFFDDDVEKTDSVYNDFLAENRPRPNRFEPLKLSASRQTSSPYLTPKLVPLTTPKNRFKNMMFNSTPSSTLIESPMGNNPSFCDALRSSSSRGVLNTDEKEIQVEEISIQMIEKYITETQHLHKENNKLRQQNCKERENNRILLETIQMMEADYLSVETNISIELNELKDIDGQETQ